VFYIAIGDLYQYMLDDFPDIISAASDVINSIFPMKDVK